LLLAVGVEAVIPYTTFPDIDLGFITLRTFGLMVALGVVVGAWVGGRVAQADWGISQDETYRLTTRMVIAAMIGARLTWDITHWDQIENPIDLIAVWEGGLQFSGGFVFAVAAGFPVVRHWKGRKGWGAADAYLYGLAIGLAIGRIGCYAVGEHFGGESDFLLAVRWDGGAVRETTLGGVPLAVGMSFHNTALYELIQLLLLFGVLTLLRRRHASVGTMAGVFCLWYGVARLLTDFLRVNDDTVLGLTGAQYLSIVLIVTGLWILLRVRPRLARQAAAPGPADEEDEESGSDGPAVEVEGVGHPAVGGDGLAGDEAGGVRGEEDDDVGDVLGGGPAA
jgi:phosphatidylglycerol:prolipoprotein diacylglycerol transferase